MVTKPLTERTQCYNVSSDLGAQGLEMCFARMAIDSCGDVSSLPPTRTTERWKSVSALLQSKEVAAQGKCFQRQILLLRHSAKCRHSDCPVSPYCAETRRLWDHIEVCQDDDCGRPGCFASRVMLSHFKNCQNLRCIHCKPVRNIIRRHARRLDGLDAVVKPRPSSI